MQSFKSFQLFWPLISFSRFRKCWARPNANSSQKMRSKLIKTEWYHNNAHWERYLLSFFFYIPLTYHEFSLCNCDLFWTFAFLFSENESKLCASSQLTFWSSFAFCLFSFFLFLFFLQCGWHFKTELKLNLNPLLRMSLNENSFPWMKQYVYYLKTRAGSFPWALSCSTSFGKLLQMKNFPNEAIPSCVHSSSVEACFSSKTEFSDCITAWTWSNQKKTW